MKNFIVSITLGLLLCNSYSAYAQEDKMKATFIRQFCKYINWPIAKDKIVVGVLGNTQVLIELQQATKGTNISVIKIADMESVTNCDLLFLPEAQNRNFDLVQSKIANLPIVVVTETESLAQRGSGLTFFVEGDKLRFIINQKAIEKRNVKVSSSLLSLAKVI